MFDQKGPLIYENCFSNVILALVGSLLCKFCKSRTEYCILQGPGFTNLKQLILLDTFLEAYFELGCHYSICS